MRRRTALLAAGLGVLVAAAGQALIRPRAATRWPLVGQTGLGPYRGALAMDEQAGRAYIAMQDGTVWILDTRSGALIGTVRVGGHYHRLAIAPRLGRLFVVTLTADGIGTGISIVDTRLRHLLHTAPLSANPHGLTVDEWTGHVFVGTTTGVLVFDARTGLPLRTFPLPNRGNVLGVYLDAPRAHLLVTQEEVTATGLVPISGGVSTVTTLDTRSGAVLHTAAVGIEPTLGVLDERTGRLFLASRSTRTIDVVDTQSGRVVQKRPLGVPLPDAMGLDARIGRVLLVASGNGLGGLGRVTLLDARSGGTVGSTPLGPYPWSVAVDEGRGRAYVGSNGGIFILDTRTAAILDSVPVSSGAVALDRHTQHLVALGGFLADTSEPAWVDWFRAWMPTAWRPATATSATQALTIDVSR